MQELVQPGNITMKALLHCSYLNCAMLLARVLQ